MAVVVTWHLARFLAGRTTRSSRKRGPSCVEREGAAVQGPGGSDEKRRGASQLEGVKLVFFEFLPPTIRQLFALPAPLEQETDVI